MDVKEIKERTTEKKEHDNIESKKHKPKKGEVFNIACKPTPKCVVHRQPHQVTLCENWRELSIVNRWAIEKNKTLYLLRSGHQRKNCPENNCHGINKLL